VRNLNIDLEELAAVVRLLKEADFSEFNYSKGDVTLSVRRGDALVALTSPSASAPAVQAANSPPDRQAPVAQSTPAARLGATTAPGEPAGEKVRAPLLGSFYSAPKPGEPPFVKLGEKIEADTVLCIIEVMKLMNSVTAGVSGYVAAIHVRDGDLVECGQPLFTIAVEP
jgi:acetyl-CoA carboxylase biotin carboxyl carrier protein